MQDLYPNVEIEILIYHRLYIESNGRYRRDNFSNLKDSINLIRLECRRRRARTFSLYRSVVLPALSCEK